MLESCEFLKGTLYVNGGRRFFFFGGLASPAKLKAQQDLSKIWACRMCS